MTEERRAVEKMGEQGGTERPHRVNIQFGKGLVGKPFITKTGRELVEIKIPNQDPADKRPWEAFVIPPSMVKENENGKSVWIQLPEYGTVSLSRSILHEPDANGNRLWEKQYRRVDAYELKGMLEAYKQRDRDSVISDLSEKKAAGEYSRTEGKREYRSMEASR